MSDIKKFITPKYIGFKNDTPVIFAHKTFVKENDDAVIVRLNKESGAIIPLTKVVGISIQPIFYIGDDITKLDIVPSVLYLEGFCELTQRKVIVEHILVNDVKYCYYYGLEDKIEKVKLLYEDSTKLNKEEKENILFNMYKHAIDTDSIKAVILRKKIPRIKFSYKMTHHIFSIGKPNQYRRNIKKGDVKNKFFETLFNN